MNALLPILLVKGLMNCEPFEKRRALRLWYVPYGGKLSLLLFLWPLPSKKFQKSVPEPESQAPE